MFVSIPAAIGPPATQANHPLHQQRTAEDAIVRRSLAFHHGAPLAKSRSVQFDLLLNARSGGEPFGRRRLCQAGETDYVTVGTIFEDSHIPLHKWLLAIHLLCASKKGMSAHQLHRMLGVTYKSGWFMAHRIRYAMKQEPLSSKLKGTVEADETYVGGKVKGKGVYVGKQNKTPVVSLVQRQGEVRSFHVEQVTAKNLKPILKEHVHGWSNLMTDDSAVYAHLGKKFATHDVVKHSASEYVRREPGKIVHTNTVEGFFSILKRGIIGVYRHVGKQHLHRYLSEFDFRYNSRDTSDGERAILAVKGTAGKRLTYQDSSARQ